jgi:predicted DNA-binding transcriptional regulator YafY
MPDDFDVHSHLENEFKAQPSIRARLQFIPEAAHIVKSNPILWETVTENPDGSLEATLTSPDLPFLASMTLSFAHWVTVLEPPELREMVRTWAQATVNRYEEKS